MPAQAHYSFLPYRTMRFILLGVFLAGGASLHAADTQTNNMNCDSLPVTDHQFQQQPGDVLEQRHLQIIRPFTGSGSLNVSVCNAELRVRTTPNAKELRLSAEISTGKVADFIHILRVDPGNATIHLKFPGDAHAVVTLTVPMNQGSSNSFNLGKGDLSFDAIGSAGERTVNVGYGHARLLVEGDKSYASMELNIGMGSLHDHRPGGHDGHFVINRNYTGAGNGTLEFNIGMGSMDISQE